jgi:ABC-type amino acid transport substrate-binding protein
MKKLLIILAVAVFLSISSVTWAGVLAKDVINVGTESTYPPYESRDENNKLQGFDIDMMDSIAQKIGKKINWVDMPFDSLIPALLSKKIDIIAAGMSATAERAKKVAFSTPYEISMSTFIVKADNDSIKSIADLNGKTITVQLGTVQDSYAKTIKGATVKAFQKFDDCVREVSLGRADATLMDRPVAVKFVAQKDFKDKVKMGFDQEITGAGKALAMNLGDGDFVKAVNGALEEMKNSGELDKYKAKWFK